MKDWFKNLKNIACGVNFFWQVVVVCFLLASLIILLACALWGLNLERSLNNLPHDKEEVTGEKLSAESLAKIFAEIKAREAKLLEATNNPAAISDPSR
jgi:hypothetical protein